MRGRGGTNKSPSESALQSYNSLNFSDHSQSDKNWIQYFFTNIRKRAGDIFILTFLAVVTEIVKIHELLIIICVFINFKCDTVVRG